MPPGHCQGGGMSSTSCGEAAHSCWQRGGHHVLPHHDQAGEGGAAEESPGREDCQARHGTKKKNES